MQIYFFFHITKTYVIEPCYMYMIDELWINFYNICKMFNSFQFVHLLQNNSNLILATSPLSPSVYIDYSKAYSTARGTAHSYIFTFCYCYTSYFPQLQRRLSWRGNYRIATRQCAEIGSVDGAPEIDLSRSWASRRNAARRVASHRIASRRLLISFHKRDWLPSPTGMILECVRVEGTDRSNQETRMVHGGNVITRETKQPSDMIPKPLLMKVT